MVRTSKSARFGLAISACAGLPLAGCSTGGAATEAEPVTTEVVESVQATETGALLDTGNDNGAPDAAGQWRVPCWDIVVDTFAGSELETMSRAEVEDVLISELPGSGFNDIGEWCAMMEELTAMAGTMAVPAEDEEPSAELPSVELPSADEPTSEQPVVAESPTATVPGAASTSASPNWMNQMQAPAVSPTRDPSRNAAGSEEDPYPFGTTVTSANWELEVGEPVLASASEIIDGAGLAEDSEVWLVPLSFTNIGTAGDPWWAIEVTWLAGGNEYSDSSATVADDIFYVGMIDAGGSGHANAFFVVPADLSPNLADGLLRVQVEGANWWFAD